MGAPMAAAIRNGTRPSRAVTSGSKYQDILGLEAEPRRLGGGGLAVGLFHPMAQVKDRGHGEGGDDPRRQAPAGGPRGPEAESDGGEQEHVDERIGGQIVQMPGTTGTPGQTRQLTIAVIQQVGEHEQPGTEVRPPAREACERGEADGEPHGGEMVGPDARPLQRPDEPQGQTRVPGSWRDRGVRSAQRPPPKFFIYIWARAVARGSSIIRLFAPLPEKKTCILPDLFINESGHSGSRPSAMGIPHWGSFRAHAAVGGLRARHRGRVGAGTRCLAGNISAPHPTSLQYQDRARSLPRQIGRSGRGYRDAARPAGGPRAPAGARAAARPGRLSRSATGPFLPTAT